MQKQVTYSLSWKVETLLNTEVHYFKKKKVKNVTQWVEQTKPFGKGTDTYDFQYCTDRLTVLNRISCFIAQMQFNLKNSWFGKEYKPLHEKLKPFIKELAAHCTALDQSMNHADKVYSIVDNIGVTLVRNNVYNPEKIIGSGINKLLPMVLEFLNRYPVAQLQVYG